MAIIDKPSDYFNTVNYAGNGGSQTITGVGFGPDFTWIKQRTGTTNSQLQNSVNGAYFFFNSNTNAAVAANDGLTAFTNDGFTVGNVSSTNAGSGSTYSSWNWLGGSSFSNDASGTGIGSVDSAGVVNTESRFSVVKWTSDGNTNGTIAHGLGVTPSVVLVKNSIGTEDWIMYHISLGNSDILKLNTAAVQNSGTGSFAGTTPTSTVFKVGSDASTRGNNGNGMYAFCFASVPGYSKFSAYTGNGNANGTFINTGFKPAFIMTKGSGNASSWCMTDVVSSPFNDGSLEFFKANEADAQSSKSNYDILSNGFKMRTTDADYNGNGNEYIYLAFAENPFVTSTDNNSIPTTAR